MLWRWAIVPIAEKNAQLSSRSCLVVLRSLWRCSLAVWLLRFAVVVAPVSRLVKGLVALFRLVGSVCECPVALVTRVRVGGTVTRRRGAFVCELVRLGAPVECVRLGFPVAYFCRALLRVRFGVPVCTVRFQVFVFCVPFYILTASWRPEDITVLCLLYVVRSSFCATLSFGA